MVSFFLPLAFCVFYNFGSTKDINMKRKLEGKSVKRFSYANAESRAKLVTLVKGNPREV